MENNIVKGCLVEKKGRYYVTIYYYKDGQRVTKTRATGITVNSHKKKEAEKIKNQLIMEKQAELEQCAENSGKHSFSDCFKNWIEYKSQQVEKTTASVYADKSKTAIKYFKEKNMMIEDLKPRDLLHFYEWELKNGRRNVYSENASRALSRRTVADHATIIKSFLNDAVVQGIIMTNPADKVSVPRTKENNVKEIAYMDLKEAKTFLKFVKDEELFEILYYISKIGLYYGLRRSEILGLKWSAIDYSKNEIEIRHTVIRADNNVIGRDNVKTASSHRYLPLLEDIKADLEELRAWQIKQGIYSDKGYIFLWEDGRQYDPDYISKLFKKAVKKCDSVPQGLTLHKLRHSCCAILFQKGWDIGRVQKWLGHSDITVTANIYNHVSKKWQNEHGQEIDGLLV